MPGPRTIKRATPLLPQRRTRGIHSANPRTVSLPGAKFLCGVEVTYPAPHIEEDAFEQAMKLQTMRPLLCGDCVDVVEASRRQTTSEPEQGATFAASEKKPS